MLLLEKQRVTGQALLPGVWSVLPPHVNPVPGTQPEPQPFVDPAIRPETQPEPFVDPAISPSPSPTTEPHAPRQPLIPEVPAPDSES